MPLAIRIAVVVMLVLPAAAGAQSPSPATLTRNAITRLATDTRALTENDAPAATRTTLLTFAGRIERSALRTPCAGIESVRRYRIALKGVNATTPATTRGEPGPP